ncbi:MAG: ATP-binding cassette domain-containing protein [Propionibacteriaceae bacterium]|nr:ATP-binding cassette domain-containing protein [Propionibacteriaceae bacterium]
MSPTPLLELRGVSHRYRAGDRLALDDINLTIAPGEFVVILGPSGSGKSTLLNILGLLEQPTSGDYLVLGEHVGDMSERQRDRLRGHEFGFIFQSANVLGDESVTENAALGLSIQAVPARERHEPVAAALDAVGLTAQADQPARLLSGGERQRVAIARALVTKPAAIFADEPTGNLDSANGERVLQLLEMLHAAGHTVILVTHDLELAKRGHRWITLRDGRIVSDERRTDATRATHPAPKQKPRRAMRAFDLIDAAFSALLARPQQALLLLVALAIGITGLVSARGIADSAASQVNTRLTAAARDSLTANIDARANVWRPDDTSLASLTARLHSMDHVRAAAWAGAASPGDVQITRFSAADPEPPQALSLTGAPPELFDLLDAKVAPSHAASLLDTDDIGPVAILTPDSAAALHIAATTDLAGVTIVVNGQRIPVVGVATLYNHDLSPLYINTVFVSRSAMAKVDPARIGVTFYARTEPGYPSTIAPSVPLALAPDNPGSVTVQTVADLLGLRVGVADDMSAFVFILAAVVLVLAVLAGGVGTYVSVVAKTAEIALRRALGTSRAAVFWLFLLQSLVIGLVGGAVGAVAGQLLTIAITRYLGWQPVLPLWAGPTGIAIGTVCGLVSGAVPAILAARRSPAQAIRE